jgi:predicted small lipoprotein YifL
MTRSFKLVLLAATAGLTLAACGGQTEQETPPDSLTNAESMATNSSEAETETSETSSMAEEGDPAEAQQASSASSPEMKQAYNEFLQSYVIPSNGVNLVAYADVTEADAAALQGYIENLANTDISTFSEDEKMAYWFNLYNAVTLDLILDNYPIDSIKDIDDPWGQKLVNVRGATMSLDEIEHDTLRENYDEPRIHFAVNCASIGCPNLKQTAWEAETLETDLDQAARDYIASSRGIMINGDDIQASSIFDWYEEDFGADEEEVLTYLSQFATGEKKSAMQNANDINDYEYDWSLNVAK